MPKNQREWLHDELQHAAEMIDEAKSFIARSLNDNISDI